MSVTDHDATGTVGMLDEGRLVRAGDWWHDKVPHLIALAVACIAAAPDRFAADVARLVLFLCSAIGLAAFGHVLNDWCDLDEDRRAGKSNALEHLGTPARAALGAGCLAVGLVPWWFLAPSTTALALVAVEVLLLVVYSAPPVRAKHHAVLGPLADAGYAYAVPMALTVVVFGADVRGAAVLAWLAALLGLVVGGRSIVWHQVLDADHDRASGATTLVLRIGEQRALRVADLLAPVEVVLTAAVVGVIADLVASPWLVVCTLVYLVWRVFETSCLWDPPLLRQSLRSPGGVSRFVGYGLVTGVLERWLPIALLVLMATRDPWWWLPTLVVAVVFRTVVRDVVTHLRDLPAGLARLGAEPEVRRRTRGAADRRRSRALPADGSVGPAGPGRWVFVLCGSPVHTRTLRTAVAHLRPLTSREIWVVTDPRRNVEAVRAADVDHVVEVDTPHELNDHQAAIWLKTSLHRHLPPGEWCYLDTDVIAIAAGVDELFEHRRGPLSFATDLPFGGNTIDNFSPWALHCGCLDRDLVECTHLRDELADRFELTIPAEWCHWNGGVFVFDRDAASPVLARWHELAVTSFGWPRWRTRDQGALIATAWQFGMQDAPRLPFEFNFIVSDPWNNDVFLDVDRGWSMGPDGPWRDPVFLHLFQSGLDHDDWDLSDDVERPILRRVARIERVEGLARWRHELGERLRLRKEATQAVLRRTRRRVRPSRVAASLQRRSKNLRSR